MRNLINGYILELGSIEGIARAMQRMGADQAAWAAMSTASSARAAMGDAPVFALALEQLVDCRSARPAADHPHAPALSELGSAEEKVRKELA